MSVINWMVARFIIMVANEMSYLDLGLVKWVCLGFRAGSQIK